MAREVPMSSTEILGTRLLKEIESEEGTLEDLLRDLRNSTNPNTVRTGILDLDALWQSHGTKNLSVTGRSLPLIYHLIVKLVSSEGTVAVVDVEGRFSPSHMVNDEFGKKELKHVYVWRPTKDNLAITLDSVEEFMLFGEHASKERVWRGLFLLGGNVLGKGIAGGEIMTVTTGWRGWLRVEREEVAGFLAGSSVEEAWGDREAREKAVRNRGWKGVSEIGEFVFK